MDDSGRLSIKISLISLLAASYAILFYFPIGFPIIGLEGARPISLAYVLALSYSLIFPVEYSASAIALGGLIISLIEFSPPFYLFNFLPGAFLALISSLYFRRKELSIILYGAIVMAYSLYPGGGPLYTYPYHIIPHLAVTILAVATTLKRLSSRTLRIVIPGMLGSFAGQAMGTLLFLIMYYNVSFHTPDAIRPIWVATILIYPVERLVLLVLGLILYLGIYKSIGGYLESVKGISINE